MVSEPAGLSHTALPQLGLTTEQLGGQPSEHSTRHSPSRHRSFDAVQPVGMVESWQKLDVDADVTAVWDKYEEVFYDDYYPVSSTYRR